MAHDNYTKAILFYDGDCGFCSRVVNFILKEERNSYIHFAALQSSFAMDLFENEVHSAHYLGSFRLLVDGRVHTKSDAFFLLIQRYLKWYWFSLLMFKIVPKSCRNRVYDWIADNRYSIANPACLLPNDDQRKRFMDNLK